MFTKGYTPWNKGKKCPKLGLHKIGVEPWNKGKKTGLAPWRGKKRPNLVKSGASKTMFKKGLVPWNKGMDGEYSVNAREKNGMYGKKPWNKDKSFMAGKKHWNWMGGKSKEKYGMGFTKLLKKKVSGRDNNKCIACRVSGDKTTLDIHHIDYNKKNNDINNLVTLCKSCHSRTNYKRNFWITCLNTYNAYSV